MNITAQVTPDRRRTMAASEARVLAARALEGGAVRTSPFEVRWDVSRGCENPVHIECWGRPEALVQDPLLSPESSPTYRVGGVGRRTYSDAPDQPFTVLMIVKCRRCATCLRRRASEWRLRAQVEIAAASRTWFGTITLRPEAHYLASVDASSRCRRRGVDLAKLSPDEQFGQLVQSIGTELTLWLKRIRKNSGAKLRYFLVAEAHKSGYPHFHVLIHEKLGGGTVTERQLRAAWTLGFTNWKLIQGSPAASYVCKYLSKSLAARVRASKDYGKSPFGQAREALRGKIAPLKGSMF